MSQLDRDAGHRGRTSASAAQPDLRSVLNSGELTIGTFVKTTHYQTVEVLAGTGLDYLVLDAEHAPFGREALDACCLAAKAYAAPVMVRTASHRPEHILQALDSGANGVLVPHVDDADIAAKVVAAARYREADGQRGFSNSPRAGGYGHTAMAEHIQVSDRHTAVMVQIETAAAVENVADIATVAGIDALFIGRADLAVSYGVNTIGDPVVESAVKKVVSVAKDRGLPLGIFLPNGSEVEAFQRLGFTIFIIGSDQSLLKAAAARVMADVNISTHPHRL